jgi:hypothetical protein
VGLSHPFGAGPDLRESVHPAGRSPKTKKWA